MPLGHIDAAIRQPMDPETSDLARRTRSLIRFLSQSPEHASRFSFTNANSLFARHFVRIGVSDQYPERYRHHAKFMVQNCSFRLGV
jgi:hypothetical protein